MIKGILFDKDGTLLDFNGTWLDPYLQASSYLAEIAGDPDVGSRLMRRGGYIAETGGWECDSLLASGSNQQIFDFWEKELGQTLAADQRRQIQEIFSHAASSYVPAMQDMGGFLGRLRRRGVTLGLATMDDEKNARGMLSQLGLATYFDFVCGADSGFGVKPDPGMVLEFCRAGGFSPAEVIMVGDSPKDLNMGNNAGVARTIAVLTGAHDRDSLAPLADLVLDNISGLEQLVS
jgi:phosphoglycolate phosphatase